MTDETLKPCPIREALGVLHSMIVTKQDHTDETRNCFAKALVALDNARPTPTYDREAMIEKICKKKPKILNENQAYLKAVIRMTLDEIIPMVPKKDTELGE